MHFQIWKTSAYIYIFQYTAKYALYLQQISSSQHALLLTVKGNEVLFNVLLNTFFMGEIC